MHQWLWICPAGIVFLIFLALLLPGLFLSDDPPNNDRPTPK